MLNFLFGAYQFGAKAAMRGFATLIVFFIGVAVVYGLYWASRAAGVAKDAAFYLRETGNVGDAVKMLWETQRLPDSLRLSGPQHKFLHHNETRFLAECEPELNAMASKLKHQMTEAAKEQPASRRPQPGEILNYAMGIAYLTIAKQWCAMQGVG